MTEIKCCRCGERYAMNCMLSLGEVTETGKIIYPNMNNNISIQIPVPLCLKCMAFIEEGFLFVIKVPNEENKIQFIEICDKDKRFGLSFWEERFKLGELTKDINDSLKKEGGLTRSQIKRQKMKRTPLRVAIIVEEMMKYMEKFKNKLKEEQNQEK